MITQLRPANFVDWRKAANKDTMPIVLDVREPWEFQTASVTPDGFTLVEMPMQSIPAQLTDLKAKYSADQPIACLCHHGMRSLQVANYLAQQGFTEVVNLQGGIAAWADQLDPSVPQY